MHHAWKYLKILLEIGTRAEEIMKLHTFNGFYSLRFVFKDFLITDIFRHEQLVRSTDYCFTLYRLFQVIDMNLSHLSITRTDKFISPLTRSSPSTANYYFQRQKNALIQAHVYESELPDSVIIIRRILPRPLFVSVDLSWSWQPRLSIGLNIVMWLFSRCEVEELSDATVVLQREVSDLGWLH